MGGIPDASASWVLMRSTIELFPAGGLTAVARPNAFAVRARFKHTPRPYRTCGVEVVALGQPALGHFVQYVLDDNITRGPTSLAHTSVVAAGLTGCSKAVARLWRWAKVGAKTEADDHLCVFGFCPCAGIVITRAQALGFRVRGKIRGRWAKALGW